MVYINWRSTQSGKKNNVVYKKIDGTRGHRAKQINPHPVNMHFLKSLHFPQKRGHNGSRGDWKRTHRSEEGAGVGNRRSEHCQRLLHLQTKVIVRAKTLYKLEMLTEACKTDHWKSRDFSKQQKLKN